jgi:F-type H+-transporting ATPase subunit delta
MADSLAASRYARALLFLAEERGELEQTDRCFAEVRKVVERHPEISHLVLNSTISLEEKEDFIEKVFPVATTKLVLHFVKVLIGKRRFCEIVEMQENFRRLYEIKQGIQEVTVVSAVPLPDTTVQKLKMILKHKLAAEIRLVQQTDPKILGGLILRFNETELNGSFLGRLEKMRQQLLV